MRPRALTAALGLACATVAGGAAARADEPPATAAAAATTAPTATPPTGAPGDAAIAERPPVRFWRHPYLLSVHLGGGVEPHTFSCNTAASETCDVAAFAVSGELLWRGLVGPALGLYASEGSPLVPQSDAQPGLGDRVSATAAVALRPFAALAFRQGDSWIARFGGGVGVELGPSLEYVRTSSIEIPACGDVPATKVRPGLHAAAHVELPLLGDAQTGWLSLRATTRLLVSQDTPLAPRDSTSCAPLVEMPGVLAQLFLGLSFSR